MNLRYTLKLFVLSFFAVACHAFGAPMINSITVEPSPIIVGEAFTVSVEASEDATEGFALVDFRPSFPSILRVDLVLGNGNWVGGASVPVGLVVNEGSPVSVKAYMFDADRARGQSTVDITVVPLESDPDPLTLSIATPVNGLVTQAASVDVTGATTGADTVTVNGVSANMTNGTFNAVVPLAEGTNTLVATATAGGGGVKSESITVRRDTDPPLVVFESPRNGDRFVSESIPIAGTVNDIIPGATVNEDDVSVTVNGVPASINNRTFFIDDFPLVVGANELTAVATDRAGNTRNSSITVSREPDLAGVRILVESGNAQRAPINSTLPDPLAFRVENADGTPAVGRPVTLVVSRGDGLLGEPDSNLRSVSVLTDAEGKAQSSFMIGSRTGEGFHRVRVTTPGSLTFAEFCASAVPSPPANIAVVMAPRSQSVVGQAMAQPLAVIVTDEGGNPAPGIPVTFQVDLGGGNFDGQQSVTLSTDMDGIVLASWSLGPEAGISNNEASATFAGNPGFPAVFIVSGVAPGALSDTTVSGVVQNSVGAAIPNVRVVIKDANLEGLTGVDGKFLIEQVPPGGHHVNIMGSSVNDPGNSIFFPNIEFAIEAVSGVENKLDQIVVLPFLDQDSAQLAGGSEEVVLTMAGVPGYSVRVFPRSTYVRNGNGDLVQQAMMISASQVKFDKVPMPPPQGSTPLIVGTLQPGGVIFDPPAEICYPNVEALAPGDVADVFAFHHDIGQFVNIGPGTVTEDGSQVCSDPGFGMVQSGWHCLIRIPGPTSNCANDCRASVSWQITKNGTGSGSGGPIKMTANADPAILQEAQVSISFTPGGGANDANPVWTIGNTSIAEIVGTASNGNTVTIKAKNGGETTLTSPIYRIPLPPEDGGDKTCQTVIEIEVCSVDSVEWVSLESTLDVNPNTGGGERIFPGKQSPTDSKNRKKVKVKATVSPPEAGFTVYFKHFDVDDPSANAAPVDSNAGNGGDNRGSSGTLSATSAVTNSSGEAEVEFTVSLQPGDNFRVGAHCEATTLNAISDNDVPASNTSTIPGKVGRYTKMLTVWRKLHVERDHMGTPPSSETFDGAGGTDDDVDPGGALPDPTLSLMSNYAPAYILAADDLGALNTNKVITFRRNLEDADAATVGNSKRDVNSQKEFWVVAVVGVYDAPLTNDFDPNTLPADLGFAPGTDGPCVIYLETIRDVATNLAGTPTKAKLEQRIVFHETLHRFGFRHGTAPGDDGPLSASNNAFGSDSDQDLTDALLHDIRKREKVE